MNCREMTPVKTGIVGCGSISDIFFRNFTQRFKVIEPVKCCSRRGASAASKAKQYGLLACTFEEMLSDPEIELIVNLTPAPSHYDIIKRSLEAGKHVFTEKVITPDFRKTQELIGLAKEKNLMLCSEPDHFMGSSWQCAREYIEGGIIGEVTSISASVCQDIAAIADRLGYVNEPGGGIGFDFAVYMITQIVSLLGPAESVSGISMTKFPNRVHRDIHNPGFGTDYTYTNEDLVAASILFRNKTVASVHLNGDSILEGPQYFTIYGTCGALSMPLPATFSGEMKLYRPGSFEPVPVLPAHGFDHDSRGVGAAEMAWSLRLGRKARTDASLGLHCQEILHGIRESSMTGRVYQLTTTCERPAPLPKGYRGLPGFSFDEEGSLVPEM